LNRGIPYTTLCRFILLLLLGGLPGCTSNPATRDRPSAHPGLAIARAQLGAPYLYGGASPRGFDCSGLVYYAYRRAGIAVPRTTTAQYRRAQHIGLAQLRPGDLVFFRLGSRNVAHVGIYAGGGKFIHAPSSGKGVAYSAIHSLYWEKRLLAAGRFE
jgi:cell wall-associated NlpC family hydrolase